MKHAQNVCYCRAVLITFLTVVFGITLCIILIDLGNLYNYVSEQNYRICILPSKSYSSSENDQNRRQSLIMKMYALTSENIIKICKPHNGK